LAVNEEKGDESDEKGRVWVVANRRVLFPQLNSAEFRVRKKKPRALVCMG
jgi:hypothetical protein